MTPAQLDLFDAEPFTVADPWQQLIEDWERSGWPKPRRTVDVVDKAGRL